MSSCIYCIIIIIYFFSFCVKVCIAYTQNHLNFFPFSIGIAALELATGEAPFAGLPLTEVIRTMLTVQH